MQYASVPMGKITSPSLWALDAVRPRIIVSQGTGAIRGSETTDIKILTNTDTDYDTKVTFPWLVADQRLESRCSSKMCLFPLLGISSRMGLEGCHPGGLLNFRTSDASAKPLWGQKWDVLGTQNESSPAHHHISTWDSKYVYSQK